MEAQATQQALEAEVNTLQETFSNLPSSSSSSAITNGKNTPVILKKDIIIRFL
jgi:hypothetical protein